METKPKNLTTKLVDVMAAIDHVEKRGYNKNQDYKFMKAVDVARAVREEFAKRNVLMLSDVVSASRYIIPTKSGSMGAVDLHVKYTLLDGDSDAQLSFHGYGSGADSGDKASPKAHTAALKYALRNTFLVPDESDPEADESTDRNTQAPTAATAVQPTPKQAAAPRPEHPKPPAPPAKLAMPMGAEVVEMTVKAISLPKGNKKSWWILDAATEKWWNTFEGSVGNSVKRGETYRFVTEQNGQYTNIIGFVEDFPDRSEPVPVGTFADGTPIPDEDCPF